MNIDTIKNGYVLDHIKAGKARIICDLLNLHDLDCQIAIITNAKSNKMGKKDIIKIGELIDIDFNKLAFIDPTITVNIVKKDKIIEKKELVLPKQLINVAICKNPRCITSIERGLDQIFNLTNQEKVVYRCMYCETQLKD